MTPSTQTILFTDIEGSTRMARALGDRWAGVVAAHHAAVGSAIEARRGRIEGTAGDSFFALFASAADAVAAAADAQRRLAALPWPPDGDVKVRMGLHRGEVRRDEHGLTGLDIHLAARVEAAAHGGQVVMTSAVREALDGSVTVADLGEHRLKDFPHPEPLHQLVYDGRGPGAFPPLRSDPVRPTNLGAEMRSLVGRDDDLERLAGLLAAGGRRLVTVTGPGGAGKTRLATAAAERLLSDFPGGVWLVPLAQLRETTGLLSAVAAAAGVPDEPACPLSDALAEHLRRRPALLVLDNLEHLEGAAEVIAPLLADAQVLATSQLPLRLAEETVVQLGPLEPDAAASLFAERAAAVVPGFDLAAHADEVAAICDRLDRLPLAIELAAARVNVLAPAQLLERLDDSLRVVAAGRRERALPERQRSIRATLEWSFGLLEPEERTLLGRLSVFAAGAPLDAVEALAAVPPRVEAVDALEGLLDASLARRWESREHGVRFAMAQAVRAFAAERLAASGHRDDARRAHAEHLASVADGCRFWPAAGPGARARLAALADEVSPALEWSRRLDPMLHARLIGSVGSWMSHAGRMTEALAEVTAALVAVGDRPGPIPAFAKIRAAYLLQAHARDGWAPLLDEGLAGLRAQDDQAILADGLAIAAVVYQFGDDSGPHAQLLDEALAINRRRGDKHAIAGDLLFRAQSAHLDGRIDDCERDLDELERLVGPEPALTMRADVAYAKGDWAAAARDGARAAAIFLRQGDVGQVFLDASTVVLALIGLGRHADALAVEGLRQALSDETGEAPDTLPHPSHGYAERLAAARAAVPDATAAEARGRAVPARDRASWLLEMGA